MVAIQELCLDAYASQRLWAAGEDIAVLDILICDAAIVHYVNLAFCLAHLAGIRHHLQPHASAIARLGGALGLSDEQIKAMTAAPALLTALSTLKLGFYRHSATAIAELTKAVRIASAQRDLIHRSKKACRPA